MNEPGRGSTKSQLPSFFSLHRLSPSSLSLLPLSLVLVFHRPSERLHVETGIGTMLSEYAIGLPLSGRYFSLCPRPDKKQTPPEIIILPG